MESTIDEDEIEKKAMEEILLEAKRAAERANEQGTSGWLNPRIASTNKNFLRRTLVSTLRHPYGSKKHKPYNKHRMRDHDVAYHNKQSSGIQQSETVPEASSSDKASIVLDADIKKKETAAPTGSWDSPDHIIEDSSSSFEDKKDSTTTPPGGYVYDAYEYSFQASKDPHQIESSTKVKSKNSHSEEKNNYHKSSFHDKKESTKAPTGGYVYDAYEYSFQGSKDPHQLESSTKVDTNNSHSKQRKRNHDYDASRSPSEKKYHSSEKSRDEHRSEKHYSGKDRLLGETKRRRSKDNSDPESEHRRKSKKKHKHKSKHKSHHKKKKKR